MKCIKKALRRQGARTGARAFVSAVSAGVDCTTRLLGTGLSHVVGPSTSALQDVTVDQMLRSTVLSHPENLALKTPSVRWSWSELDRKVGVAAHGLTQLDIGKGDRVGSWLPNIYEYIVLQYASARVGAVLVTLNPAYRGPELAHALQLSGCKAMLLTPQVGPSNYTEMLAQDAALRPEALHALEHIVVAAAGSASDAAVAQIAQGGHRNVMTYEAAFESTAQTVEDDSAFSLSPSDAINIQFTSGTTGLPKAVELSHHNIVNNGANIAAAQRLGPQDRVCIPVPLYHCFGMVLGSLACASSGAGIVFPSATFAPGPTLQAVQEEQCTALYGVPTMFIAELDMPTFSDYDLSSLRTGIMAGSICPADTMEKVMDDMHLREITIAYGMTETSPVSWQSSVDTPAAQRCSTVGRVHPHVECKIVATESPENGEELERQVLPIGEAGELWTRGYNVMLGYHGDDAATKTCITEDGWMKTGDLAVIDQEGYCSIVGRIKDTIIRGGENIAPREIEDVLFDHELVSMPAVVGVPDEKYGEQVAACVVLSPGVLLKDGEADAEERQVEAELRSFCKERLSHFKVPKYFVFIQSEDLPMTVSGKIQKHILSNQTAEALGL